MTTITTNNTSTVFADGQAYCAYRINADIAGIDEDGYDIMSEPYVLIEKIEVPIERRGQGIARRLLREAVAHAKAAHPGISIRLVAEPLDTKTDMDRLVAFYESEGFTEQRLEEGMEATIILHDENGNRIQETGIIEEILEEDFLG